MAWTPVSAACGHTYREQMYGHHTERDRRVEFLAGRECPDCYKTRIEREHAEASAKAATANADLPALTGSPRQVAWAETIRAKKIGDARHIATNATTLGDLATMTKFAADVILAAARAQLSIYIDRASSKEWIDSRQTSAEQAIINRARKYAATASASDAIGAA